MDSAHKAACKSATELPTVRYCPSHDSIRAGLGRRAEHGAHTLLPVMAWALEQRFMTDRLKAHAKGLGYPPELLEPIRPLSKRRGLLAGPLDEEELKKHLDDQRIAKLALILKHYKLEGKDQLVDFGKLAICLLVDWIPGFAVVDKPPP